MSTYVLVADGGTARLFRQSQGEESRGLEEVATLVRSSAHVPGRALVTERTGSLFSSSGAVGALGQPARRAGADSDADPHEVEVERFARRVLRRLDDRRLSGELDHLLIVAEPRFLGVLRRKMSKPTRRLVEAEVVRDLVREDVATIQAAVAPSLH